MGSCIGRCFCEVGKCFCCDCFVKSNLRETITRRRSRKNKSQTFTLRRQSSSTTIEFENLMFEFDIPVRMPYILIFNISKALTLLMICCLELDFHLNSLLYLNYRTLRHQ
jgi:hypothetical protein